MAERREPIILAVDGIDGSGKTSLVTEVNKRLVDDGVDVGTVSTFHRPEDEFFWETYRHAKADGREIICPASDQLIHSLLFVAVCRSSMAAVLKADREASHDIAVLDRYVLSRMALARWGMGPASDGVEEFLLASVTSGRLPSPTATIFLEVDPELAHARILAQNHGELLEEKEQLRHLAVTAEHYADLSNNPQVKAALNIRRLDATRATEDLATDVIDMLELGK